MARKQYTVEEIIGQLRTIEIEVGKGLGVVEAVLPTLRRPRVARAKKIIRLHPPLCSGSTGPTRNRGIRLVSGNSVVSRRLE